MSASHSAGCEPEKILVKPHSGLTSSTHDSAGIVRLSRVPNFESTAGFSWVESGVVQLSVTVTPKAAGTFREQAQEALAALEAALAGAEQRMTITTQTIFLRDFQTQKECEQLLSGHFGSRLPVTSFVLQPPCSGAGLALEALAVGGNDITVERFGSHMTTVSYEGVHWLHCAGISSGPHPGGVYAQTMEALERMHQCLTKAGGGYEHVVRTWFYLGDITETERDVQRYKEFNRARTDFYRDVRFCCSMPCPSIPHGIYPASTGIGMAGTGLVAGCLALRTERSDAYVLPLENPHQTPAYAYHPKYSPQSPKFSRAKAVVLGRHMVTLISGTASVVHSESRHAGDLEQQTQQTIDNIEQLLTPENFAYHGVRGAGAGVRDLANIRIYLKSGGDFAKCKAICDRRFGAVPAIYAVADICRPDLLVEIEGVAFSRYTP